MFYFMNLILNFIFGSSLRFSNSLFIYFHFCLFLCVCVCVCIYMYINIYIVCVWIFVYLCVSVYFSACICLMNVWGRRSPFLHPAGLGISFLFISIFICLCCFCFLWVRLSVGPLILLRRVGGVVSNLPAAFLNVNNFRTI